MWGEGGEASPLLHSEVSSQWFLLIADCTSDADSVGGEGCLGLVGGLSER